MAKSPDAFRTISEVADWLGVQAHVLRFWESKFTHVKPIKRAGGRRYYRPTDMLLIGGLKKLLHEDGLTIKGAQKLLREKGVSHVAALSQPLDDLTIAVIEGSAEEPATETIVPEAVPEVAAQDSAPSSVTEQPDNRPSKPVLGEETGAPEEPEDSPEPVELQRVPDPEFEDHTETQELPDATLEMDLEPVASVETTEAPEIPVDAELEAAEAGDLVPTFRARARSDTQPTTNETFGEQEPDAPPVSDQPVDSNEEFAVSSPDAQPEHAPTPRVIDVGPIPDIDDFEATPSALSAVTQLTRLTPEHADEIRPLLARLTRLRASMASPRKDVRKD